MVTDSPIRNGGTVICAEKWWSRHWIQKIMWYALGMFTPFLVIAFLAVIGVRPPKSNADVLIDKWLIKECKECNETRLLVSVPTEPNNYLTLGIERDPETGLLREIGITKGKGLTPDMSVFLYKERGKYNTPIAYYGSPEQGLVWRDLNTDGVFDQRIDYHKREMEIYVGGRWIKGMGKEEVTTDEGLFAFDPNVGEWKKIQPSGEKLNELPMRE